MKVEKLNDLVTGNWYIKNNILHIEYKRFTEGAFGIQMTYFNYISEERIEVADWNDELKQQVIEEYKAAEPTPDTTQEIVREIAEGLGDEFTPNGVMAILNKAGVYIKKTPASGKSNGESKGTRVSKADAIDGLKQAIEANGIDIDDDIIGKLTGKAAVYFKTVIEQVSE
jgi:hypothetical protein